MDSSQRLNDTTIEMNEQQQVQQTDITLIPKTDDSDNFVQSFDDLLGQVENLSRDIKTITTEMKTMKKKCTNVIKSMNKGRRRKAVHDETVSETVEKKEPSGFVSPIEISNELADFLQLDRSTLIPRTVVTKQIIKFVKDNKLHSATNGRQFDLTDSSNPKAQALKVLFGVSVGDEVGYFNLQAYLKHHFKCSNKKMKACKQQEQQEDKEEVDATNTLAQDTTPVVVEKKRKIKLGKK